MKKIIISLFAVLFVISANAKTNNLKAAPNYQQKTISIKNSSSNYNEYSLLNSSYDGNTIVYDGSLVEFIYPQQQLLPFFALQSKQPMQIGQKITYLFDAPKPISGFDKTSGIIFLFPDQIQQDLSMYYQNVMMGYQNSGMALIVNENSFAYITNFQPYVHYIFGSSNVFPKTVIIERKSNGYELKLNNESYLIPITTPIYPAIFGSDEPNASINFKIE